MYCLVDALCKLKSYPPDFNALVAAFSNSISIPSLFFVPNGGFIKIVSNVPMYSEMLSGPNSLRMSKFTIFISSVSS